MIIKDYFNKYSSKLDSLDLELIIAHALKKSREFILAHPEYNLNKKQEERIKKYVKRRLKHEPIAYILGQKEFYGLDFKVNKHVLIPRPETEHLVEEVLKISPKNSTIIDLGTGSGNIIISLAKNLKTRNKFIGIDISKKALCVAEYNAKKNKVDKKIKFIQSDLLNYFFTKSQKLKANKLIIVANLPYLSEIIYSKTSPDVKNFEPKSALLSGIDGLNHYEKLFRQIKKLEAKSYPPAGEAGKLKAILEISPEQKQKISKLIKKYFPKAKVEFQKDLAGKWRVASFEI
ncbi:MAG TPA: peptide chain release factor N(5)-glutamine methyltransferase [Candidatus Moranbacteria bacterium]|nr:peptide chain release factor N(5)-glutamine methyltransferase [Candidatus Moranbacteria bacterium]